MDEDDYRQILLIQAVEECDGDGVLLTDGDRREASVLAGAPLPKPTSASIEDRFLADRAAELRRRLAARRPELAKNLKSTPPSSRALAAFPALLVVAAIAGYLTNELGPERRINILAFPLLGLLAWSLLVYLREISLLFRRGDAGFLGPWLAWTERRPPGGDEAATDSPVWLRASALFEKRWRRLRAPLIFSRLKARLHLAALVLAASAVGGMYVKGLANEYRAVWESTFFIESAQLRPFLRAVLGPAAALRGDEFPSLEELDAIQGAGSEGESAARWIHWYALTVAIFVLGPRGALALLWHLRARRLARGIPYRSVAPRDFERLLLVSSGATRTLLLVPYAFEPELESFRSSLEEHYGGAVEMERAPTVAFGEEEDVVLPTPEGETEVLPVFNFAATPERETHLALYRTLSSRSPKPVRSVVLETSAFDRKSASFAEAASRRADREAAWRGLFRDEAVEFILSPP